MPSSGQPGVRDHREVNPALAGAQPPPVATQVHEAAVEVLDVQVPDRRPQVVCRHCRPELGVRCEELGVVDQGRVWMPIEQVSQVPQRRRHRARDRLHAQLDTMLIRELPGQLGGEPAFEVAVRVRQIP